MTSAEFDQLLKERIDKIQNTLALKAGEYAKEDHLHNFKRAAEIRQRSPALICLDYWTKHYVSLLDIVDYFAIHGTIAGTKYENSLDEKIGDAINYLILLEAILKEKQIK